MEILGTPALLTGIPKAKSSFFEMAIKRLKEGCLDHRPM